MNISPGKINAEKNDNHPVKYLEGKYKGDLREIARQLLSEVDTQEGVALHWGMAMLVYPFFPQVAR